MYLEPSVAIWYPQGGSGGWSYGSQWAVSSKAAASAVRSVVGLVAGQMLGNNDIGVLFVADFERKFIAPE